MSKLKQSYIVLFKRMEAILQGIVKGMKFICHSNEKFTANYVIRRLIYYTMLCDIMCISMYI